eukprot:449258-Rhodomonas_salina.1
MVSYSADGGRAEGLSRFSDCILAVRGEATSQSREHLKTVYANLRMGRTLKDSLTALDVTARGHNLVLLPSGVQEGNQLRIHNLVLLPSGVQKGNQLRLWQLPTGSRPPVQVAFGAECVAASSACSVPGTGME